MTDSVVFSPILRPLTFFQVDTIDHWTTFIMVLLQELRKREEIGTAWEFDDCSLSFYVVQYIELLIGL